MMNIHVTRKKAAETTFVRKIRTYNVDEIDTCTVCQVTVKSLRCYESRFRSNLTKL